jgi:hypothetical protein
VKPIDAPDGEVLLPVMTITPMLRSMVTMVARRATRVLAVVKGHPEIAGGAAVSASWSTNPRGFRGDHRGTIVRRGLG